MDDYFMARSFVPAFGSWNSIDYLPFTDCYESARQDGLLHYTHQGDISSGDLCVTGDLYQNDVVTPAMIVVPRTWSKSMHPATVVKQTKAKNRMKREPVHPTITHQGHVQSTAPFPARFAKPVDEDLYKISPDYVHANAKKKTVLGFFTSCCFAP